MLLLKHPEHPGNFFQEIFYKNSQTIHLYCESISEIFMQNILIVDLFTNQNSERPVRSESF